MTWSGQTVSVVLPTYAEKESIRGVVDAFYATGVVDEVLVVNNNAESGTSEEIASTRAREVHEDNQGYGHALRRGMAEASGDIVVLCEPDGTFAADDIFKLLSYSDDCDAVFGTRTNDDLVWHGANMHNLLRWGNWLVAQYMRALFQTGRLSDVGCTYKLLKRDLVSRLHASFEIGGSQFGPELMIRTVLAGARVVEVPVNYLPRVGISSVTGHLGRAVALGLQMVLLITTMRLRTFGADSRPPRKAARPVVELEFDDVPNATSPIAA